MPGFKRRVSWRSLTPSRESGRGWTRGSRPVRAGLINPILVDVGCRHPKVYGKTLDHNSDVIKAASPRTPAHARAFQHALPEVRDPWMVVSVPYGLYVSSKADGRRRLGYRMPNKVLRTEVAERIVKESCEAAGVPFVSVTEAVRRLNTLGAYYALDGHPTAVGTAIGPASSVPRSQPDLIMARGQLSTAIRAACPTLKRGVVRRANRLPPVSRRAPSDTIFSGGLWCRARAYPPARKERGGTHDLTLNQALRLKRQLSSSSRTLNRQANRLRRSEKRHRFALAPFQALATILAHRHRLDRSRAVAFSLRFSL